MAPEVERLVDSVLGLRRGLHIAESSQQERGLLEMAFAVPLPQSFAMEVREELLGWGSVAIPGEIRGLSLLHDVARELEEVVVQNYRKATKK